MRTIDPLTKLLPLTVSEIAPLPAVIVAGVREVTTGIGLAAATVMVGLVASRVYPLFANNLNSYDPGVAGIAGFQLRVVAPAPT
jgi:hypothetical protein